MPPEHPLDDRLTEIEIKLSYAEDLLDTLNQQVARQQALIDQLVTQLRALRQQPAESPPLEARNLRDELPPHY
jgi:SlyX protein